MSLDSLHEKGRKLAEEIDDCTECNAISSLAEKYTDEYITATNSICSKCTNNLLSLKSVQKFIVEERSKGAVTEMRTEANTPAPIVVRTQSGRMHRSRWTCWFASPAYSLGSCSTGDG